MEFMNKSIKRNERDTEQLYTLLIFLLYVHGDVHVMNDKAIYVMNDRYILLPNKGVLTIRDSLV